MLKVLQIAQAEVGTRDGESCEKVPRGVLSRC